MPTPVTITIEDIATSEPNVRGKLLHFVGQLDETNIDIEAKNVYDALADLNKGSFAIMDLAGLTYMNSKSIGYLTDWHQKMQRKGASLVVASAPENIMDILNVVGLSNIVSFYGSVDEAMTALVKPPQQYS